MLGFAILVGFVLMGELLHYYLEVPLPGNVLGLILFTISLFTGVVKLEWVEKTADLLLKHLILFFIPVIVAVITTVELIQGEVLVTGVGLIGSAFLVLLTTGLTVKHIAKRRG